MAVVLKPISEDLGWSRTLTAAAITMGLLAGGLLAQVFGPMADRLGPRLLLPAGAGIIGISVIALSLSTEPWQFYATFMPARRFSGNVVGWSRDDDRDRQLVLSQKTQSYGVGGTGGAVGLLRVVAGVSILYRELRLAQCFPGPRNRSVDFRRGARSNLFTAPA